MKKIILAMFVLVSMAGCTIDTADLMPSAPTSAPRQVIEEVKATSTPQPTATIDYMQTAIIAEQNEQHAEETSIAANVIVLAFTAEYETRLSDEQIARSEADAVQAQALIESVNATASFAPTAVILMSIQSTAVVEKQLAHEKEPTVITALTQANMTEGTVRANNAVRWAVVTFIGVLTLFVVMKLIAMLLKGQLPPEPPADEQDIPDIIPFESVDDNPNQLQRIVTDIPCTPEQLIELADGICKEKKTLAWRHWNGSSVYGVLEKFRKFMYANGFSEKLENRVGEFLIPDKGMTFLEDTRARGYPPPPYRCIG